CSQQARQHFPIGIFRHGFKRRGGSVRASEPQKRLPAQIRPILVVREWLAWGHWPTRPDPCQDDSQCGRDVPPPIAQDVSDHMGSLKRTGSRYLALGCQADCDATPSHVLHWPYIVPTAEY